MGLKKIEAVFFDVLEDLKEYLPDLTIVGGWMPFLEPRMPYGGAGEWA